MHETNWFLDAFVYLAAAVISVPLAKRWGLGSVLGYLCAGVLIGPHVLALVGNSGDVMHFAEFGVVMMLFLIGLELRPAKLWTMKVPILGFGGSQVIITTVAAYLLATMFGFIWQQALAIGLIIALSSTAIVLQSLAERGEAKTPAGKSCFSILLFQDIAVIPILAIIPMLATIEMSGGDEIHAAFSGWSKALVIAAVVAAVILAGRYVIRPLLRKIADTKLPELFTATALLIVISMTLLMNVVGLSPALGTFLAGVVLADSEFRHELESDIEPFKGLLLGLFFISVGASINFSTVFSNFLLVTGCVLLLIALKFAVLFSVAKAFKHPNDQSLLVATALAQGSEFAFVMISFSLQSGVIDTSFASVFTAVIAISMLLTPIMFIVSDRYLLPKLRPTSQPQQSDELVAEDNSVIIVGYGRFGQIVGRLLAANGFKSTVLDLDANMINMLAKVGQNVYYGDGSRVELLERAGAHSAKAIVIAVNEKDKCMEVIRNVQQHFPHLKIFVKAIDRRHGYELINMGIQTFRRETFDSALELGRETLQGLGFRAYQAHRAAKTFAHHDENSMIEMSSMLGNEEIYFNEAKKRATDLAQVMKSDLLDPDLSYEDAWDHPELHTFNKLDTEDNGGTS